MDVILTIPFIAISIILILLIISVFYIFITQPDASNEDDLSNSDDNSDDCYIPYHYDDFI